MKVSHYCLTCPSTKALQRLTFLTGFLHYYKRQYGLICHFKYYLSSSSYNRCGFNIFTFSYPIVSLYWYTVFHLINNQCLYDSTNVHFRAMSYSYFLSYPSPAPRLMRSFWFLLTQFAISVYLIPCKCSSSSVMPTHLLSSAPTNTSHIKYSIKSSLFHRDLLPALFCSSDLALTFCTRLSKPLAKLVISRLCFIALSSWACVMDFVCFSFLVFSSSSFVEKGAKEVNSLTSCTSKNAFILFSHMIYTMDNLEVEIFLRILKVSFCYLSNPVLLLRSLVAF